jgi:hypothetical protein
MASMALPNPTPVGGELLFDMPSRQNILNTASFCRNDKCLLNRNRLHVNVGIRPLAMHFNLNRRMPDFRKLHLLVFIWRARL